MIWKSALVFSLVTVLTSVAQEAAPTTGVPPDHADRMARGLHLFQEKIRPALIEHCVKCHGGEKTKGDLDLTTREGLLRGGSDGPVVKPFDPEASRLLRLIAHTEEPAMPSKADALSPTLIAEVKAWITDGAPYDAPLIAGKSEAKKDRGSVTRQDRDWWAFRPLHHEVPASTLFSKDCRTPVDAFIEAKLVAKNLHLNPSADRRTLIRRAALDLLGLPPTPEEVEAFERDRSPDAWARLVDRLLDNPHYGERWARHWLDVARFAESSGFEHDYDRPNAYHYRDFVIRALNADLPYDQFVRWQLAGDEFEPGSPMALMATGFLGAGVFPTQITANEVERTRYDALDDMLSTTGTAFLGLTIGCARCHDHKFDPIPTHDYYRLLSTFTTTVRSDIDLDLQPEETRRVTAAFDQEHAPLVEAQKRYEREVLGGKFDAWLASGAALPTSGTWELFEPTELKSQAGATFRRLEDGSHLVEGTNGDSDIYTFTGEIRTSGLRALRLEALADPSLPHGGPGRAENGNVGLSRVRVFTSSGDGGTTNELHLVRARADFEQNAQSLSIASALDDNARTGWAVDPQFGTNHVAVFEFDSPVAVDGRTRLTVQLEFGVNTRHNLGRPRLSLSTQPDPILSGDVLPPNLSARLAALRSTARGTDSTSVAGREALLQWWKRSDPEWQSLAARVDAHVRQKPQPKMTKVLVCAEGYPALRMHTQGGDFLNETHFLQRGSTDQKKGVATPGFLQVLLRDSTQESQWRWQPPEGAKFSGRRRSLAQWMTDANQGAGHLLARVMVNRLWQHHFGTGLVATPNDFGVQGTRPSHPELLDYLADELIRSGWHLKHIHRLLMNSAVYQQSSEADPVKIAADPANTLLSRNVPRRLEAEAIRDSLLSVSGALDPTLYGPGTLDPGSRRRSVYFTVKRSQLIPAMQAFDAPEPLVSQATRPTTTVAPQALFLMNSPAVRSWAAAFAQRCQTDPTQPLADAVARGYRLALNRVPTEGEKTEALEFIAQRRAHHQAAGQSDPAGTALIDFAQVLLSLNEFIYAE